MEGWIVEVNGKGLVWWETCNKIVKGMGTAGPIRNGITQLALIVGGDVVNNNVFVLWEGFEVNTGGGGKMEDVIIKVKCIRLDFDVVDRGIDGGLGVWSSHGGK